MKEIQRDLNYILIIVRIDKDRQICSRIYSEKFHRNEWKYSKCRINHDIWMTLVQQTTQLCLFFNDWRRRSSYFNGKSKLEGTCNVSECSSDDRTQLNGIKVEKKKRETARRNVDEFEGKWWMRQSMIPKKASKEVTNETWNQVGRVLVFWEFCRDSLFLSSQYHFYILFPYIIERKIL